MKRKKDALSVIVTVTIIASAAVTAAVAAFGYIICDKLMKKRQAEFDDYDDCCLDELPCYLDGMIADDDEEM